MLDADEKAPDGPLTGYFVEKMMRDPNSTVFKAAAVFCIAKEQETAVALANFLFTIVQAWREEMSRDDSKVVSDGNDSSDAREQKQAALIREIEGENLFGPDEKVKVLTEKLEELQKEHHQHTEVLKELKEEQRNDFNDALHEELKVLQHEAGEVKQTEFKEEFCKKLTGFKLDEVMQDKLQQKSERMIAVHNKAGGSEKIQSSLDANLEYLNAVEISVKTNLFDPEKDMHIRPSVIRELARLKAKKGNEPDRILRGLGQKQKEIYKKGQDIKIMETEMSAIKVVLSAVDEVAHSQKKLASKSPDPVSMKPHPVSMKPHR